MVTSGVDDAGGPVYKLQRGAGRPLHFFVTLQWRHELDAAGAVGMIHTVKNSPNRCQPLSAGAGMIFRDGSEAYCGCLQVSMIRRHSSSPNRCETKGGIPFASG